MRQVLGPGALGRAKGIGSRGRWEGKLGWGTHVNPWLIHVNVWQKPLQYCKVISLQLIKINEKKKKKKKRERDTGLIPGSGRSPGGGHGNPLQYFGWENLMDRGLVGYCPWCRKQSDTIECIREVCIWGTFFHLERAQTRIDWMDLL